MSEICFNGPLVDEFEALYSSLFEHHTRHVNVVKALAKKASGLTNSEISAKTKIASGGTLTTILSELEESGFIVALCDFGKTKKNTRYRLVDEYSLFYLKWIIQAKSTDFNGVDPDFWLKMSNSPAGRAWSGYAFENLCMKHIRKIKEALQIGGVRTSESSWSYRPDKGSKERGVQIDLIIDRADQCINLCEIKFASDLYTIDKDYAAELRLKKDTFIEQTRTRKSIFLTLITTYGLKKVREFGVVDVEITLKSLFG